MGCELDVVELASDWQGVAALWFQLLWVVVTAGPLSSNHPTHEGPRMRVVLVSHGL
jgi:hypothetical protein